jgi:hypothetical protein
VRNTAFGFLALIMGMVGLSSTTAGDHSPSALSQTAAVRSPGIGPHRWVYASRSLKEQKDVSELIEIARQASAGGMNGMVLSGGYSRITLKDPAYLGRLKQVQEGLSRLGVELIPIFMTAGYGDGLEENPNLAAGLPVRDALFVARGSRAELIEDPAPTRLNGGFEEISGGAPSGFVLDGKLGGTLSVDSAVRHSGQRSLRFDCRKRSADDPGYVRQQVAVHPYRCYVLRGWIRTAALEKARDFSLGHIRFEVKALDNGRRLQYHDPGIPAQSDWMQFAVGFNSWGYSKVEISIGNETSHTGEFWLDDIEVAEAGPVNILRRPGTPVTVRGETNGMAYQEGSDFQRITDPKLNHRFDHEAPPILLTRSTRIKEGERLRISWYHSAAVYQSQVSICMSEPEIYEIWRGQVRALHEHLRPNTYLLSMDEIRAGGSCEACVKRGLTMGQILGDCLSRQVAMIREANPKAEIAVWSDMLDPNHNGRKNPYYLVNGDFDGSWNHIPKDMIIAVWGRKVRPESFEHFSGLGFRTLGAAYYDTDNLEDVPAWIEIMQRTKGSTGMMYTTWLAKYKLLPDFARLLGGPKPPGN